MTSDEFAEVRLQLLYYSSDLGNTITNRIRIGVDYDTKLMSDIYKLYCLNRYIDIFLEYTPQSQEDYEDSNINFFSVTDMLFIQEKINEIINTDFALDFYLTS